MPSALEEQERETKSKRLRTVNCILRASDVVDGYEVACGVDGALPAFLEGEEGDDLAGALEELCALADVVLNGLACGLALCGLG